MKPRRDLTPCSLLMPFDDPRGLTEAFVLCPGPRSDSHSAQITVFHHLLPLLLTSDSRPCPHCTSGFLPTLHPPLPCPKPTCLCTEETFIQNNYQDLLASTSHYIVHSCGTVERAWVSKPARPGFEAWPENNQLCDLGPLRDLSEIHSLPLYDGDNSIHLQRCCQRRPSCSRTLGARPGGSTREW